MSDLKSVSIPIPCPDCGQDLLYFDMIDCIICDNQDGCDRYVVFVRTGKRTGINSGRLEGKLKTEFLP